MCGRETERRRGEQVLPAVISIDPNHPNTKYIQTVPNAKTKLFSLIVCEDKKSEMKNDMATSTAQLTCKEMKEEGKKISKNIFEILMIFFLYALEIC